MRSVEDLDAYRGRAVLGVVGQDGGGHTAGHARCPEAVGAEHTRLPQQLVDAQLLATRLQRVTMWKIPANVLQKAGQGIEDADEWDKR